MLKKSLGQHFLVDEGVLEREAAAADVKGRRVLEIGAGDGRLTEKLLKHSPKKLIAIEKDEKFAELLRKKFAQKKNVEIVHADFLEYNGKKFEVIVGNIPYYISSPILFRLKGMEFERAVVCLQKEFAERMVAEKGTSEYSKLSVMSSIYFEISLLEFVPASSFSPQPKVDSAVLLLHRTGRQISSFQEKLISALFQHRKKTLRNALVDSSSQFGLDKKGARELMQKVKNSGRRVFTLGPDELLALADELEPLMARGLAKG